MDENGKAIEQCFTLSAEKVRHRLLIRKQIEISPRLVPLVRFLFELIGFNVKLDVIFFRGISAIGRCPISMGIHYGKCGMVEEGGDAEDTD